MRAGMVIVIVSVAAAPAALPAQAEPDPAWERLFTRTDGWTGGDGAGTVALPDGRILWMFGDSWIGRVADGRHAPGARLVNNALAVHAADLDPRRPAAGDSVAFAWGAPDAEGHPTAWIAPPAAAAKDAPAWYWPVGGGAVVPSKEGGDRLLLFLWKVARTKEDRGVWSFRNAGNDVAVVDAWREPVGRWKPHTLALPHARWSEEEVPAPHEERSFGQAAFVEKDASGVAWLYVYGIRQRPPAAPELLLARVQAEDALAFDAWRFHAGGERWIADAGAAAPLATGLVTEFSVEPMTLAGQRRYVLVQSEPFLGRRVLVRTAPHPSGPWSPPTPLFEVPDLDRHPTLFTYAAKGHAALSPPGALLVTYVVNATDFGVMVADASLYRPRFLRVPLAMVR